MSARRLSIVVPVYNEADNIEPLLDELTAIVPGLDSDEGIEVLLVDDGSTDSSLEDVRRWQESHGVTWLWVVPLEQNRGQSAATMAGVDHARGRVICTMDGDLQNDPRDIVRMLEIIERGDADGVCGVRVNRRDTWVRRAASRIGNRVRDWITGDRVADSACGLKAFRADLLHRVPRFDGMHRFLSSLVRIVGGKVVEIPVMHRERHAGVSKYGVRNRAFRGLKDCFAVRWYRNRLVSYEVRKSS